MRSDSQRWQVEKRLQLGSFLKEMTGKSGKEIRRLLEKNCCKINGRIERFASTWLEKGQVVEFTIPTFKTFEWKVLFENESFQIVDKPANWVCNDANAQKTFPGNFLVHRLDKDTTGALILAKNIPARDELMALFSNRQVEKEYFAVVDGVVRREEGTIENHLARKGSFQGQTIWGSSKQGDLAITRWKVVKRGPDWTLVCCRPLTGRTHQIRVHMAEMGHPLLIDRQYSSRFKSKVYAERPLLHAYSLRFSFRGQIISVICLPPDDFKNYL